MVLSRLQCKRFFALFDALTVYANERLGVVEISELMNGKSRGIDETAQAKVAFELWQNLGVIDDFVRDNPSGLTAGELECVAAWREGLTDSYLVDVFPDGEVRFIDGGFAFEVMGVSEEIAAMLPELPAVAHTTLIPFDGSIVYAGYLNIQLVQLEDGVLEFFGEEIARIYDEGLIVSTPDELLDVASALRESALARDTEGMLADLEDGRFDTDRDDECECGHHHHHDQDRCCHDGAEDDEDINPADYIQHYGALAGLSFDEREQAIQGHMLQDDQSISGRLVELLDDECEEIPFTTSLAELLAAENIQDVHRFAGYLGMENTRGMGGDELIEAVVAKASDAQAVQVILDDLTEHHIASMRKLAERGGRWDVAESDVTSLRDLPVHELGFSYVFHEGETFSFAMPDELLAVADKLDWEGALQKARRYRELTDLVDDVVELRGIASIPDIVAEYQRCYPDGYASLQEVVRYILQAAREGNANYELLETPTREMYALHYELFWAYEEVMGLEDDRYIDGPVTRGELGSMLEDLLKQHEGKDPRPLSEDMLSAANLYEWKLRQEPTRAFVQYLDAHVPATGDDYYFADKVMEELLNDAMWGIANQGAQRLFDILDNNGFMCEPEQIQEVLDLWSDLSNGLPIWPDNGWAPIDLEAAGDNPRL